MANVKIPTKAVETAKKISLALPIKIREGEKTKIKGTKYAILANFIASKPVFSASLPAIAAAA